jgi:hypothetical protein|tara:strand:+ start:1229 stop:3874 length:2646 start_codon:yes stop_codon:yes gene_type:complete
MRYSIFTLLLFFYSFSFSQIKISGKINDKDTNSLQGASIVVTKTKGDIILTYAISNTDGSYALNINSELDSLQINISYIGYAKQIKKVLNKSQMLNFNLLESSKKLKGVIIKSSPITKIGDTISYSVNAFKEQKDRVIADVLRKLPGIEVLVDGKILYQGKPIQKYYIEGLDLLEGKYNLANNNLPASSVSKVQILENHQPIKILDSLVFSDKASLNIKLKKNITVTGTSKLGVGLSPLLWNVNITPMLFTKKQQMIASYQTNNVGNDISNEIKTLTIEDLLDQFESNNEKKDWVTIQELSSPPFSKKRWLDNNAHLLTTNYLVRLKKDLDLKVNLSYINDFQQQNGNTQTTFFTPTDTINIIENTNNRLFFNSLKSKFILTKNTNKNYFKNTFEANNYWDSQNGKIVLNNENINQETVIPFTSFINKLKIIKPFGKKLITVKSILSYSKSPQNLRITPSQFEDLLNNSNSFDELNQKVKHSNFYANNSFSFTKGIKKFTFIPKVGFTIQNQKLDSRISIFKNNIESTLIGDFQNNLIFNKTSFYTILNTQYRNNNWKIELETPLNLQTFKRIDNSLNKKQNLNKLTFEPRLSIKKDLNAFWKTTFSASLKNSFGDINQLYYGYLLNNYRNIQKYETPILESLRKNVTFGISYRNPIKSIFINGFYSYGKSNQNLLFGNSINDNGTTSFGFFEQDNNSNTHNINLRGSKYFSRLKTTLTATTNASLENKEQLLNGVITDITTKNIQLKGELDTEITEWMSVEYKNKVSISNTKFESQQSFDNIITQEHLLNFNFYPTSNQYIGFNAEYYKNNFSNQNQENYFLNLNYRYTFKESRIDLELNWNNILNTKEFTTVFNDAFSYTQSTFRLRPRQILMSMKFNF